MKNGTGKRRTRQNVNEALHALMLEKPYDSITVQDLLDRSSVSRSTFYSHFDNKDDVLVSYHAGFWEHISKACMRWEDGSLIIAPVAALAAHLREETYREFALSLIRAGRMPALRALALDHLSRGFESELMQIAGGREPRVPLDVTARFIATTCFDMVIWGVESGASHTPAQMEAMFQKLVQPSIESALGISLRHI